MIVRYFSVFINHLDCLVVIKLDLIEAKPQFITPVWHSTLARSVAGDSPQIPFE